MNSIAQGGTKERQEALFILHMPHALLEEGNDVFILHSVIDFLAIPPCFDQTHLAQAPHVVGYR
jgi:hypothetical protein